MNSYALFVVLATLLACVALEVAGLCIPRCSDGNSCTKDLCDDDGICVYATELPVQFGCCMTDRDCRHYCTMPKYHCRESRCECVAGDRTRIDDEDHDFPPEAPGEYEYEYDDMPEDDGNNDGTTLMVADPTNIVEGGEEEEAGGVPWVLIGAIGGVALLVVLILLVGMIAVACVVVSSQGKKQVGERRYHPASINAPSSSAIVDDDAYYSNSDL